MTNARDFGNIMEKAIRPVFQREIAKYSITKPNTETDEYLAGLLNDTFAKNDIKYVFYYPDKPKFIFLRKLLKIPPKKIEGVDEFTDKIDILNIYYDIETKEICIDLAPGFSKFFFPDKNKEWKNYLSDFKMLIQHEKVHLEDFSKIPSYILKRKKFGTGYDIIGGDKKKAETLRDVKTVINHISTKNLSAYDITTKNEQDPEGAKELVSSIIPKYKNPKKFKDFMSMLMDHGIYSYRHDHAPTEIHAIAQDVIIDFFRKGYKPADIIKSINNYSNNTPSYTYNELLKLCGNDAEDMTPIRYEIGKKLSNLIDSEKKNQKKKN
jgi:hypothetical protein